MSNEPYTSVDIESVPLRFGAYAARLRWLLAGRRGAGAATFYKVEITEDHDADAGAFLDWLIEQPAFRRGYVFTLRSVPVCLCLGREEVVHVAWQDATGAASRWCTY